MPSIYIKLQLDHHQQYINTRLYRLGVVAFLLPTQQCKNPSIQVIEFILTFITHVSLVCHLFFSLHCQFHCLATCNGCLGL